MGSQSSMEEGGKKSQGLFVPRNESSPLLHVLT